MHKSYDSVEVAWQALYQNIAQTKDDGDALLGAKTLILGFGVVNDEIKASASVAVGQQHSIAAFFKHTIPVYWHPAPCRTPPAMDDLFNRYYSQEDQRFLIISHGFHEVREKATQNSLTLLFDEVSMSNTSLLRRFEFLNDRIPW